MFNIKYLRYLVAIFLYLLKVTLSQMKVELRKVSLVYYYLHMLTLCVQLRFCR